MCELTFVGCPSCNGRATEMSYYNIELVTNYASLDEDGDIVDYDGENDYQDSGDCGYKCPCGWTGSELDHECVEDCCECRECVPPDPADEGDDPDEIVWLVRRNDSCHFDRHEISDYGIANVPKEIRLLLTDRTIHRLPIPRWRATELHNDWLNYHPKLDDKLSRTFEIDLISDVRDDLVQALMLPYTNEDEDDPDQLTIETEAHVGAS